MKESNGAFLVTVDDLSYEFSESGFIREIRMNLDGESVSLLNNENFGTLRLKLSDGRCLHPFVNPEDSPEFSSFEDARVVVFSKILWRDEQNRLIPGFRLSLRYELWPDGRGFANAFFCPATTHSPDLDQFSLCFDLALGQFPELNWANLPRPGTIDGAVIQSVGAGRYLERGGSRFFDGSIVPAVNFNARKADGHSAYFEILVEGQNALNETASDNFTRFTWTQNGDFLGEWSFLKEKPCVNQPLHLFQWRNQWGWVLKGADRRRHKPPFHMYHYLDESTRHFPTVDSIRAMAEAGADVLVLHENWRHDLQDGGIPYEKTQLLETIEEAHKHKIRVLLYMRGNEPSATESACEWFDRYLKKNYDGLYMDYGGAMHHEVTDEAYPGGRCLFRNYFLTMKALRERVGTDGLFLGHTGPFFSAIAITGYLLDGYVSGEGESGVMVNSRREHEYFSMAAAVPGTMWTGAFPVYSSSRMRPFLAATGQYPHSPLGIQFISSSLAHPYDPGLNDAAFKPLWKLWRFFRMERNLQVWNDYNSAQVFEADPEVGHYLMVSSDRKRALLILSNFKKSARMVSCRVDWGKTSFDPSGSHAWVMTPTETSPGPAREIPPDAAAIQLLSLESNDVAALLFSHEKDERAELEDFERPYPGLTESNQQLLQFLQQQKEARILPPASKAYVRIVMPAADLPFEFSLTYDLYLNSMALVEFSEEGEEHVIGWFTRQGIVPDEPKPEDYIWPSEESQWIPLHEYLSPGTHHLGVKSVHFGKPFYSFLLLDVVTGSPDPEQAKRLHFMNDLEPDRQYLRWFATIQ